MRWTDKDGTDYFETEADRKEAHAIINEHQNSYSGGDCGYNLYAEAMQERRREVNDMKIKPAPKE